MSTPVLEARAIAKRFGGVIALRGVSFELAAGEIHALCGENGAGKSTLIKLLAGIHPHGSYDGRIVVDGHEVQFRSTRDAETAGIAVIHQELALFPDLTIAENLLLGNLPTRHGLVDWNAGAAARTRAAGRSRPVARSRAARWATLASVSSNWSKSRAHWRAARASWCWTNPRRRWRDTKSTRCWRWCSA